MFPNGGDKEIRLRAWLKVAYPTFKTELLASPDWQYIAPHHRKEHSPAILATFIEEVQTKYRHKHRNDTFKVLLEHSVNCSAVEVLFYMTHYYFRSAQDFTPRNPPWSYPEFRFRLPSSALHPPPSVDDV